ncbi:hypothetical protein BDV96DRAFT_200085 [Lophiotrema nucula]|uniref:Uncharacterized protein n=1 Tax=Lophiotrema nucula TaxID=690887 RepID=A0A6A5YT50_9PLEO|nr:hypothetical protein BDV96DRAFT_200085 [Lophiotrema nucula]
MWLDLTAARLSDPAIRSARDSTIYSHHRTASSSQIFAHSFSLLSCCPFLDVPSLNKLNKLHHTSHQHPTTVPAILQALALH